MSQVTIQGNASGNGTLTIAAPNTSTDYTLTLPAETGTVITTGANAAVSQAMLASGVAGTGPAFSAYLSANQTVTSGVQTKVQCNTEVFDTASCYDNATNYRFTPNVDGYYQISATVGPYGGAIPTRCILSVYKNGTSATRLADFAITSAYANGVGGSCLVYLNGSTDYVELYAQINVDSGTPQIEGVNSYTTTFVGVMVRAA
jgi:hypothetical protein